MRKILFIVLLLATFPAASFEILSVDTVGVTVTYTEPTQNVDGSSITDLEKTVIYYNMGEGEVTAMEITATASTGGGIINQQIPVNVGENQEINITFYSRAFDSSGNQSGDSNRSTIRIDRLPPAPPN